jgi:hypothetical protein
MTKRHRVKTNQWISGILETLEHEFNSFEEAIKFVTRNRHRNAKIYNPADELVRSISSGPSDTYA